MDEGRIEQLEKMFPNGFLILVPRNLEKSPLAVWMYFSNPKGSPAIDQMVDDVYFSLNKDSYWQPPPPKEKKDDEPQG